jgi:hypothetical protein
MMKLQKHSVFSFLVLLWFVASSLVNVLFPKEIYPSYGLQATLYPNDVINLFLGVVALLLCTLKAARKSRLFLPFRSAMLLFILYNAIVSVYANTNGMDIMLLLLAIAAVLTLVEAAEYQKLLEMELSPTNDRRYASILIVFALIFILRAVLQLFNKDTTATQRGVSLADILLCSLWLANGIGFLRNPKRCFLPAFISYIHGSLLFLSLVLYLVVQPLLLDTPFQVVDFVVISGMSLACFLPRILLGKQIHNRPKV